MSSVSQEFVLNDEILEYYVVFVKTLYGISPGPGERAFVSLLVCASKAYNDAATIHTV